MKIFIKQLTIATLLTSSIFASSDNYSLLNDMELIKIERIMVEKMSIDITEQNKKAFSKILDGLIVGDSSLNLKGTEIAEIRGKLIDIKEFWDSKKDTLDKSSLNNIITKINEAIELYDKSYNRYMQKQKIATLVTRHTRINKEFYSIIKQYEYR